MSIDLSIQTATELGVDVTTIKLRMKYPSNNFDLKIWEGCPYSLKCILALEYKHLHYKDLEFHVNKIFPYNTEVLKRLEAKTGYMTVPQLKVQYKNGVEETWLGDSTAILKFLDSTYPSNSLFFAEDTNLNLNISLLEDWIDEAFKLPYQSLLFLNKNNLNKITEKWTQEGEGLINKAKLQIFKKDRTNGLLHNFGSRERALEVAYKRFDEELLPLVGERLEVAHQQGHPFLFGQVITAADLALYSFLKLLLNLEEANLITRRAILNKFIDAVENVPLNAFHVNEKKGYTRHKLALIGDAKKDATALNR